MSIRRTRWGIVAVASAMLVAGLLATRAAHAAESFGPAFGNNSFTTEIRDANGEADVDDYVTPLLEGESLSVTVSAAKGSALVPSLVVLDPDGVDRTPALKSKSDGRKVGFKKLSIDATGAWTVRVAGADGTQGAYSVKFKTAAAKATTLKKQSTSGGTATHTFGYVEDGLATIQVKYAASGAPVTVAALRDPSGDNARSGSVFATARFVTKGTKIFLKKQPLEVGSGDYTLQVTSAGGEGSYTVKIAVAPQARPTGKAALPADEPFLDARAQPMLGVAGKSVVLTGQSLGTPAVFPTVLFAGVPGQVTQVAIDGTSLTVVPPTGTHGATVAVAVVDGFGQASVRDGFFTYVPPPTMTRLETLDGAAVTGGSTNGGESVRLIGTGFVAGQSLRFGNRIVINPVAVSPTELRLTTPASPSAGPVTVTLTDAYDRQIVSAFGFTYKRPPTVGGSAVTAYSPPVGKAAGGTLVTLMGSGFESQDRIEFDGTHIVSTLVSGSQRTFVTPPRTPGMYTVELIDRYGARVAAPDFQVKAAPAVSAVSVLSGEERNGSVGIGGGAVLRIDGSDFYDTDVVTVGGSVATAVARSATQVDVTVPSVPPGSLDVVVTDQFGDSATATDAANAAGFDDVTSSRSPGKSSTDDLGAVAAVTGDLDGDGKADDLVIVGATGGSRTMRTRQLRGDASGVLVDVTASAMPSAATDATGASFGGSALAIGDLDGSNGPEIIVANAPVFNSGTYNYYDSVRVLRNDGSGGFSSSSSMTPQPSYYYYRPLVTAYEEYGYGYYVGIVYAPQADATATALAVGDLDRDGDMDVVSTSGGSALAYFYRDPTLIDFTVTPYFISYYDVLYGAGAYYLYALPGTRVLDNSGGGALVDRSLNRLGVPGNLLSTNPGYYGRDIEIGDVDGTNGPDIVVTWDDPRTVSVYGSDTAYYYGASRDTSRVATRVLLNDGAGRFRDATSTWLPAGGTNEFWQGDSVELVDVVGSSRPDLLILHETGPATTKSALRILRNDGPGTGFTDVTSSVLPSVTATDNLGGTSLLVQDADGDGRLDLVIGTTRSLTNGQGARARSTRILFGTASGTFVRGDDFLEAPTVDSGETRFLVVGDLAGRTRPTLVLGNSTAPAVAPGAEKLRVFDWEE